MGARRLHHPCLGLLGLPGEAGDAAVVLDPEQDVATLEIEQRGHFPGQTLGRDVVALELDTGALTVVDECGEFSSIHACHPTQDVSGRSGQLVDESAVREPGSRSSLSAFGVRLASKSDVSPGVSQPPKFVP